MGQTNNYYIIMSTITKTNFGQITFKATIAGVGF